MKKIIILLVLSLLFVSCSSGWSCKNRYVNNAKPMAKTNVKKSV